MTTIAATIPPVGGRPRRDELTIEQPPPAKNSSTGSRRGEPRAMTGAVDPFA
jgi:hypothetical protein